VLFPYASAGYDADRRIWRKPDVIGDAERFNVNLRITHNVLGAALAAGATKLVMGSSLADYGFYYPSRFTRLEYLPIDENHPLRPDDPYGLTKLLCETLADGFARKNLLKIVSLRFPVICAGDCEKLLREQATAVRGYRVFWSYLHIDDAAVGRRLALESDLRGHHAFNVCAPTTLMARSTIGLVRQLVPEVTDFRRTDRTNRDLRRAAWDDWASSRASDGCPPDRRMRPGCEWNNQPFRHKHSVARRDHGHLYDRDGVGSRARSFSPLVQQLRSAQESPRGIVIESASACVPAGLRFAAAELVLIVHP
jgi:hypothetical protein